MPSHCSFVVYVDESGDEGFRFDKGSSSWFVLSGVIIHKLEDLPTVKLVDRVRSSLEKQERKPIHFRRLKHEQRIPFVKAIAEARLRIVSVLVHKQSLLEPEKFQEPHRLYFYAVRYLLERISWYCRDNRIAHDAGDGSADIVFSNRSGMPYDKMKEYFRHLKERTGLLDVRIDWDAICPDHIRSCSPGKGMGLQIADAVASSSFYAVEVSRYGYTEPRYLRMLKPVIYRHKGCSMGYGLKFWPREVVNILKGENYEWIGEFSK